jgi:uncharacterized membrane protein YdbT with pleckstrin-like domain
VPFPTKLLNDAEEIILDLRPHWATIFWPVTAVVVAIAVAVAGSTVVGGSAAVIGGVVLIVVAMIWLMIRYLRWTTTNFVVTTDRLIYRSGVLSKHGREIPLERVNDISFHQSVFERMIGAGDLVIESAGEHGQTTFEDIPKPSATQNEIYRQIEQAQGRNADRMAGHRELSVPEQLDKLDDLRQRGVISQAEFDQKKSQLLDRM